MDDGRDGAALGDGKAFCPKDANGKDARAEAWFVVAWRWGYRTSGRGIIAVGGEGRLFTLSKFPRHDKRERMRAIIYSGQGQ